MHPDLTVGDFVHAADQVVSRDAEWVASQERCKGALA